MKQAIAVSIFVIAYVLIATEWVHRVVVVLSGAGVLLLFRIQTARDLFHSERLGIDWNVIFLLFGMMVIVAVMRQTGVFEFLAIWSAKRAGGRPFRVFVFLLLLTAVASALLDNVTTMLLTVPVTLLIAHRLGTSPVPYLIAMVMASNIGGTATLVGDPPNILIGSRADLSYLDFLVHLGPIAALLLVVFVLLSRFLFRGAFEHHPERVAELMALDEREALRRGALLNSSIGVLVVVTIGFLLHGVLHYEPSVVALLGAGALLLIARREPAVFLREVDWQTLVFIVGLFAMVGGLVKTGVVDDLASAAVDVTGGRLLATALLLIGMSAVLSALVDNIPYVATMAPLVITLIASINTSADPTVLWWSLALGANLGGNATPIGASANVVVLGIAARSGLRIRFLEFAKYGIVVTAVTIAVSALYVWVRYFAFA